MTSFKLLTKSGRDLVHCHSIQCAAGDARKLHISVGVGLGFHNYAGQVIVHRFVWFSRILKAHHLARKPGPLRVLDKPVLQFLVVTVREAPVPSAAEEEYCAHRSQRCALPVPSRDAHTRSTGSCAMAPPKNKGGSKKPKEDEATGSKKSKDAQSINVRHILCEKFSKKEEALAKVKAGEGFDKVAREMSEDKARQAGSLGWKTKGSLDPAFEEVVFKLDPSTVSKPQIGEAKTGHGYHIIMVEGKK